MYKHLELITTIREQDKITSYLFNKSDKILLPIDFKIEQDQASLVKTLLQILRALNTDVIKTKIYLFRNNHYYTYITIRNKGKSMEINIPLKDALLISSITNTPIYIRADILLNQGIFISKRLILEALEDF